MESEALLWSEPNWTGYLDKYEENAGLWNRRFFLLQGPFLFYFLNELDRSSPLGLLALEGSQITEGSRECSRKYTLVIRVGPQYAGLGKHDNYILATTSAESLKNVIQRLDDAADPPEILFGYLHKTWARAGELRGLLAKSSSDKKLLASAQGLEAQAIKTELVKSYLEMEELLKRVENKVSEADKKEQDSLKATALRDILSSKGNESNKTRSLSKLQYEIKLTRELCQTLQRKANYLQGQGLEDLTEEARNLLKRLLRLAMEVIHERHAKIRAEAPRYSFPANVQIYNRGGVPSKVSTLEFAKSNAGVLLRSTTSRIPSPSSKSHQASPGTAPPIPDVSKTSAATKGELPLSKFPQTSIAPYQATSPTSNFTSSHALLPPSSTPLRPQLRPPLRPHLPGSALLFQPPPPSQEESSKTALQSSPTETSEEPVPSSQTLSLRSPLTLLKSFLPSQFRVPRFAPFLRPSTSSATAPIDNSPPSLDKSVHSQPVTTKPPSPAPPRPLVLGTAPRNAPSTTTPLQLRNPGPTSIRPNLPITTVPPSSSLATQKHNQTPSSPATPQSAVLRPAVLIPSSQNSRPSPMLLGGIHPSQLRSPGPATLQQRMPLAMPQQSQTMPASHIATALRGKLPADSAVSKTPLPGPLAPPGGSTTAGGLAASENKPLPFSQPAVAAPSSSASIVKSELAKPNLSPTSKQPLPSPSLPTRGPSLQNTPTTSSSFPPQSILSPASLRGKLPANSAFQPPKPNAAGSRPALPAASPAPPLISQSPRPVTDPRIIPPSDLSQQPVSMPSQNNKPPSNAGSPPRSAPQPRFPFPGQPPSRALMLFPPFEFKIPSLPSKLPMPGNPNSLSQPPSPSPTLPPTSTIVMSSPPQLRPKAPGITGPPAQSPFPSPHRSPTRITSPYTRQPPPPPLPSPSPGSPPLLKKPVGLPGSDTHAPPRSPSQPLEKPAGAPPAPPPPPVLSTTTQGNKVTTKLPSELEETNERGAATPQGARPPPPPAPSVPPFPRPMSPPAGARPPPPSAPSVFRPMSPPAGPPAAAAVPPSPRSMPPQFSPPPPRPQGMGMAPSMFRPPPSVPPSPRPLLPHLSPAGARPAPPVPPSPRSMPPQISPPPPRPQGMVMAPSVFRQPPRQAIFPVTPTSLQPPAPLQGPQHPKTDSGYREALKEAAATAPPPPAPALMSQSPRPVTGTTAPTMFRPPPPPPPPLPVPPRALPSPPAAPHSPHSTTLPSSSITAPAPAKPPEAQKTLPSAGPLRRSSSSPTLLPSCALVTRSPFQQQLQPPPPRLPVWLPRGTLHRPPPPHVDLNSKVVHSVPQAGSQQSAVGDRPFPKLAVDENTEKLLDTVGFAALNLLKHIFNQAESYIQHNQEAVLRGVEASKDWIQKALPSTGKDRAGASKEMGSDASIHSEKRDLCIELRRPKSSEIDKRDEPPELEREMRDSDIGTSEEATKKRDASTEIKKRDKAAETRESEIEKHEEATQTRESASIEKSRDPQTEKRNESTSDTKERTQADSRFSEEIAASDVSQEKVPASVERVAPELRESLPEAESRKLAVVKQKPVATQTETIEESSASVNEQARQLKPMKADSSAPSQRKAPRQQRAQETLHLQNCAGLRPLPVLNARKAPKEQVSPNFYGLSPHVSPPVVKWENRACYSQPNDPYRRTNTPLRQVQSDAYGRMYSPQEQCQDGSYRRLHTPQQQGRDDTYQRMMNSAQGHMRPNTPQVSRPATLRRPVRMEMDYELSSDIDLTLDSQQGNRDSHSKGVARHQTPSPTPSSHSVASIVSSRHPSASSTSDSESGSEDNDSDASASTPQISIDLSCTYEFDFISRR